MITIPPKDGFGSKGDSSLGVSGKDSLLLVVDVLGSYQKTASAHGTHRRSTVRGCQPSAPHPLAPPRRSTYLRPPLTTSGHLIQGTGPVAKKGKLLVAQYEGMIWRTGKVFNSTWTSGAPTGFQIGTGQVIKGWDDGLVGKRIGSQVLLVVPPADSYGKTGSSSAAIKAPTPWSSSLTSSAPTEPALRHAPAACSYPEPEVITLAYGPRCRRPCAILRLFAARPSCPSW